MWTFHSDIITSDEAVGCSVYMGSSRRNSRLLDRLGVRSRVAGMN